MLEKTLQSPLDSKEFLNQSILKEISPEYSLEGLILKLQYFDQLTHLKRSWCWEWLKVGGEGDDREWDDWIASPTQRIWVWASPGSWWWTGKPGVLLFMGSQRVRYWGTELNWTELNCVPRIVPDMVGNHCTQQIEKAASHVLKTSYRLFKWILKNIFKDKGYGFHQNLKTNLLQGQVGSNSM